MTYEIEYFIPAYGVETQRVKADSLTQAISVFLATYQWHEDYIQKVTAIDTEIFS